MMIFHLIRFTLFFLLFLTAGTAYAEVAVPPLQARVTDLTGTLTPQQKANIEETLRQFEAKKGSQIAVLIVPTTQPEAIEQYSLRVAEKWKLGRKGIDDGALLLIAKDDRKLRIEVGYGLEGIMPDVIAKRIVSDTIAPYFRQGDYYGGIQAGVDRMIRTIEGEPLPPPTYHKTQAFSNIGDLLFVGVILIVIIGGVLRAIFGRFVGASIGGGVAALILWVMLGSLVIAGVAGFIIFLLILMGIGRGGYYGGYGGGGFGGFGGGGGDGGFGGGGGGFGGGGASGSW